MRTLIILLFVICLSINVKAQTAISKDTSCSFLKNLNFKNDSDTLVIKGILVDLIQLAPFTTYDERFLKNTELIYTSLVIVK